MTITDRLIHLDPTLELHNEGEWSQTISDYSAFNDAGVECEVGEFLYSMVRILKPQRVLETGTHWGIGTSYMALALKDNGVDGPVVVTLEFLKEIWGVANARFHRLNLPVVNYLTDAASFTPPEKEYYGLILLDTEPQTRFSELVRYFPYLKEGGYIFIHDLHPHMHQIPTPEHAAPKDGGMDFGWPWGRIPEEMAALVREGKLRPMHFRTPRGFTGFYKPAASDYQWK